MARALTSLLQQQLQDQARAAGFDAIGFTPASTTPERIERLDSFIREQRHGSMGWMETRILERADPQALWPEARSVIMLGFNYGPDHDPLALLNERDHGVISVYAQNKDYHDLVKKRLKRVARWLAETHDCAVKVFVDTAPVMEKPLAAAAGLGWQGKHTNLVSREHGSWLFLGAIYTDLTLTDARCDEPTKAPTQDLLDGEDHCGTCHQCLDICPTKAFPAPYQLDARRCISYLTIEHKGPIPKQFRKAIGNRIYGCDDCLAVCPWNKFAQTTTETAFHPREALKAPLLETLAKLNDSEFRTLFSGSPIKRIKRERFVRNVLIAIANSQSPHLEPVVTALTRDPSPLIRGAAVWALSQLLAIDDFQRRADDALRYESDETVRKEWLATPD